jgi:hypothetical protein
VARLATIAPESDLHREAQKLVATRLMPAWNGVRAVVAAGGYPLDASLAIGSRVLSPSDFGFHNCLVTASGLKFIDFEYAGWDDPAKTVCDFFCQPSVPVPMEQLKTFSAVRDLPSWEARALAHRIELLMPVYEVKWVCIMLNEFLPSGNRRRIFAGHHSNHPNYREDQLHKATAALEAALRRGP